MRAVSKNYIKRDKEVKGNSAFGFLLVTLLLICPAPRTVRGIFYKKKGRADFALTSNPPGPPLFKITCRQQTEQGCPHIRTVRGVVNSKPSAVLLKTRLSSAQGPPAAAAAGRPLLKGKK